MASVPSSWLRWAWGEQTYASTAAGQVRGQIAEDDEFCARIHCEVSILFVVVTGASEGIGRGYALEVRKSSAVLLFVVILYFLYIPPSTLFLFSSSLPRGGLMWC